MDITNLRIGPSGVDDSFYEAGYKRGYETPEYIHSIGLNAFEYPFGHGLNTSIETCSVIGNHAREKNILYSVHAPYYINFANKDPEMIKKSIGYVIGSVERLYAFGGKHVVFHPASQGKLEREDAVKETFNNIKLLLEEIYKQGMNDVFICPETMGKSMQIGTYKEIIDLCSLDEVLVPCFDFGHINAITCGGLSTVAKFKEVFAYSNSILGEKKTKNCHIHFSKIQYGSKGEIKHLDFDDRLYGPDFNLLAKTIKDLRLTPTIICESSTQMCGDALKIKAMLEKV